MLFPLLSCPCSVCVLSLNGSPANSDAEMEGELEQDDDETEKLSQADPNEEEEDDEDDGGDIDPNEEHLSAHTKSLIAHLASLPGFGQTKARLSYVPYTGPEPTGSTLAELQLPWRCSPSFEGAASSAPSQFTSSNSIRAPQTTSAARLRNKTVSLDRRRGTNVTNMYHLPAWPSAFLKCRDADGLAVKIFREFLELPPDSILHRFKGVFNGSQVDGERILNCVPVPLG